MTQIVMMNADKLKMAISILSDHKYQRHQRSILAQHPLGYSKVVSLTDSIIAELKANNGQFCWFPSRGSRFYTRLFVVHRHSGRDCRTR